MPEKRLKVPRVQHRVGGKLVESHNCSEKIKPYSCNKSYST